jgi:MoaA/NifB/PqqE/SkfB family radical SAM enzyme
MTAKFQSFYSRNRRQLHEIVPLKTPITVSIEASSACDLRCSFCAMSSKSALEQRNHKMVNMSDETFLLVMEQLKQFPQKYARVYFSGLGEVLMHPKIAEMIRTVKRSGITDEVMIFTNAVNLTPKNSLDLVDAGLDIVTISVNGLCDEDYERNCGRKIDFKKYVGQIEFLYKNKGNLRINLKTVDLVADTDEKRNRFFDLFGESCDYINIETIAPYMQGVDYTQDGNIKDMSRVSKFGELTAHKKVCSLPFYKLFISSLGRVNFCDAINGFPLDLDVHDATLYEIWNGEFHRQFLIDQLRQIETGVSRMCKDCTQRDNCAFEQDDLDPYSKKLYSRIVGE